MTRARSENCCTKRSARPFIRSIGGGLFERYVFIILEYGFHLPFVLPRTIQPDLIDRFSCGLLRFGHIIATGFVHLPSILQRVEIGLGFEVIHDHKAVKSSSNLLQLHRFK